MMTDPSGSEHARTAADAPENLESIVVVFLFDDEHEHL